MVTEAPRPTEIVTPLLEVAAPAAESDAQRLRSKWLDDVLDPDRALPQVTVVEDDTVLSSAGPEPNRNGYRVYGEQGEEVGVFRLETQPKPQEPGQSSAHLTWIQAHTKGKGYGRAMYLNILKSLSDSVTLESDKNLQPGSFHMWEWLESRHMAIRNPGTLQEGYKGYVSNGQGTAIFRSVAPTAQMFQELIDRQ